MVVDTLNEHAFTASSNTEAEQRPRPRSTRSWRSRPSLGRSRSRPRSPDAQLHRIYSSGFPDDHGTYVSENDLQHARDADLASEHQSGPALAPAADKDVEKGVEEVEAPSDDLGVGYEGFRLDSGEASQAPSLRRQQTSRSARSDRGPNVVSWDGPDDPENPKNWSTNRKWAAVLVVSSFTFISPVSSSMVAPALPDMDRDLGVTDSVTSQMILSIFILAYAIGPLFLGPLSEVYGRVPVLQLANLFFLIFNLVCGFANNGTQMLVFRFFAGIGGSAPLAIGGGILADCFTPEQRGKAIGIADGGVQTTALRLNLRRSFVKGLNGG